MMVGVLNITQVTIDAAKDLCEEVAGGHIYKLYIKLTQPRVDVECYSEFG